MVERGGFNATSLRIHISQRCTLQVLDARTDVPLPGQPPGHAVVVVGNALVQQLGELAEGGAAGAEAGRGRGDGQHGVHGVGLGRAEAVVRKVPARVCNKSRMGCRGFLVLSLTESKLCVQLSGTFNNNLHFYILVYD